MRYAKICTFLTEVDNCFPLDGVRFLVYVTGNRATAVAVQAAIAAARALATCARHPACAVAMMDHGVLAHALALLSVSREVRSCGRCLYSDSN